MSKIHRELTEKFGAWLVHDICKSCEKGTCFPGSAHCPLGHAYYELILNKPLGNAWYTPTAKMDDYRDAIQRAKKKHQTLS